MTSSLVAFAAGAICAAWVAILAARLWARLFGFAVKWALILGVGALIGLAALAHGVVQ